MGNTANLALPYPSSANSPDVPFDLQQLAEAIDAKLAKRPRCKITANPAGQTIANTTLTTVDFAGGSVVYDTNGMADLANDQIVIQTTGYYIVHARVAWAIGATGYRGNLITRGAADFLADDYRSAAPTQATIPTFTTEPVLLTAGDLINLKVVHSQGTNLNLSVINGRVCHLAAWWVGGQ